MTYGTSGSFPALYVVESLRFAIAPFSIAQINFLNRRKGHFLLRSVPSGSSLFKIQSYRYGMSIHALPIRMHGTATLRFQAHQRVAGH